MIFTFDAANEGYTANVAPLRIGNPSGGNWSPIYQLPLPTLLGAKKLYCTGFMMDIRDADSGDKINRRKLVGLTANTDADSYDNLDDLQTIAEHIDTFGAVDLSIYRAVVAYIFTTVGTAVDLDIGYCAIQCYYDT